MRTHDTGIDIETPAPVLNGEDHVDVVYNLDRISLELASALAKQHADSKAAASDAEAVNDTESAEGTENAKEADRDFDETTPRALVVIQGKGAKHVFGDIAGAGIATIIPLMGDWRLDANPKLALESVTFGNAPSRKLFTNPYAVLQAAEEARANAIFLGFVSMDLVNDNRFLQRAADKGMRVFVPFESDASEQGWIECVPAPNGAQPTEWRTCHNCKLTFDNAEFVEAGHACPSCGTLARLSSDERIEQVLDPGSFKEWDANMPDADPLDFPGYAEKIAAQREKTGRREAVRCGEATIEGYPVAVGFMEPGFFMGSMGSIVGEKVARLFDRATEAKLPVVLFCASGGARMQEGLASLMQMAKTACAVERHDRAGLLYIAVLTDPTTGGVTASFATLGDIILAEPKTLIGFAGQRVIRDTIKQELPEGFQTAEFALQHGLIDGIIKRPRMRKALGELLALHSSDAQIDALNAKGESSEGESSAAGEKQASRISRNYDWRLPKDKAQNNFGQMGQNILDRILNKPTDTQDDSDAADNDEIAPMSERDKRILERRAKRELKRKGLSGNAEPGSAWESVQLARNTHRPTAWTYIRGITDTFFELHGDRAFADDNAIVGGIGTIEGIPVTIIAQEKGSDLNDRIRRNFGCPQPEGYRKSARLMRQAQKFGRPIVCLVDTQGAFCGTEAEERGQGNAIAENLALMAGLTVPVVSVLLGEGGSGGALALAVSNRVAMQENAVYSVLSPEGFASILWKDGKRAPEAADVMGMNSAQVQALGVVDDVISEGEGAAHENPDEAVANVAAYIQEALAAFAGMTPEEIVQQRQFRFAKF